MLHHLKFAVRLLAKQPGFTAVAVLTVTAAQAVHLIRLTISGGLATSGAGIDHQAAGTLTLEQQAKAGEVLFKGTCSACHQDQGQGIPGVFPPLAKSDYLMADKQRSIRVVLEGLQGRIDVNGVGYQNVMPPLANLTDHEIADVLTYVRNAFGNQGEAVTDAEVAAVRAELAKAPVPQGHP